MTSKSNKEQYWPIAAKKYKLSCRHVDMAKKLGLNPKKLGSISNHKQQSWKAPLGEFIESIYQKRSGSN